jgi:serine/threonine protein kinase
MDKGTGEMVAIKIIPICDEDNEDELTKIVREIDHLKKCDSPYVTAYYGSYFRNKRLWVRALLSFLFFRSFGCVSFSFFGFRWGVGRT